MGYNVAIDGPAGAGKSTIAKAGCKRKRIYICRYGSDVSRAWQSIFWTKKLIRRDLEAIAAACEGCGS